VVINEEGKSGKGIGMREYSEYLGEATNNVAEYTAVIVALELAKNLGAKIINHYVDSQLVANQLMGKFKIKAPHIKTLFLQAKAIMKNFDEVKFTQVPRETEGIRQADKLVNQALDGI